VFIVTAAGPAIKLALVQVKAISKIEIEKHIAKIEQQIAPERAEVNSAVSRAKKEFDARTRQMLGGTSKEIKKKMADDLERSRKEREDEMQARLAARQRLIELKELSASGGVSGELRARQKALNSAAPFFVDLPQPVATAKTDADGRFELTIPEGEYVLVASAERTVFKDVETYFWVVRLNPEEFKVTLSNDNLTGSGSPDSLLRTNE
jgi:hypothetical protein